MPVGIMMAIAQQGLVSVLSTFMVFLERYLIVPALLTSAGDACLYIATVTVGLNAAQGRSLK
ncbi:hypothetical protein VKT23_010393 [Stygiomarasmius scandens]|uniref:Uncharacterized protein n=1 Tax=Marasmiellus scandens TaxID=2682957 RepID=A0ABR1JC55_9AGAR